MIFGLHDRLTVDISVRFNHDFYYFIIIMILFFYNLFFIISILSTTVIAVLTFNIAFILFAICIILTNVTICYDYCNDHCYYVTMIFDTDFIFDIFQTTFLFAFLYHKLV